MEKKKHFRSVKCDRDVFYVNIPKKIWFKNYAAGCTEISIQECPDGRILITPIW